MRKEFIDKLEKIAGQLEEAVLSGLKRKTIKFTQRMTIGRTKIFFPTNPIKSDGSVDIMFQFRGGTQEIISKSGLNAVIVVAEAGGVGGAQNKLAYGNAQFVNSTIKAILDNLRESNENVKIGKLGFSAWSGGYAAIHSILQEKGMLIKQPDAITLFDGMHHSIEGTRTVDPQKMKVWIDFANKAKQDPNIKFIVLHSSISPTDYTSTTQTANYLAQQTGLNKQKVKNWNGRFKPYAEAKSGGLDIIQMYGPGISMPYQIDGQTNVPGTLGWQHIQALRMLPDVWKNLGW